MFYIFTIILYLAFLVSSIFLFPAYRFLPCTRPCKARLTLRNIGLLLLFLSDTVIRGATFKKALKISAFRPLKCLYIISYNLYVRSNKCLFIRLNKDMAYTRFLTAVSHPIQDFPPTLASVASSRHLLAAVGIFFGVSNTRAVCQTIPRSFGGGGRILPLTFFLSRVKTEMLFKGGL